MTLSSQTDIDVFQSLRAGNLDALGIFYDRYGALVYRLALRILGNKQEAEDLTQDVFLSLTRNCSYDAKRGSMYTFLMILTRSRAIDRIRKMRSQQQSLQKWSHLVSDQSPDRPMENVTTTEISGLVREALQTLPDKHRQVLEMAYYEGQSQSEIAKNLEIPLGTIKSWARQGLLGLRKILKDVGE
ncbi:sigma-70 family RNA polymerase sigma factor [Tumidithrix elongata RA019]|uniref:Sigma-70 family RNA polymerase sigma factor n=1 Tax=Tumidithrix elongata BACA0141 TaxID=2716417 RepID=A0AAW9Q6J7_9CYAN|nr:sigma-70 family RNA polymerase sigma factor [Tumidithrix elongata RA019]